MQRTLTSSLTFVLLIGFIFAPFATAEAAKRPTKFLEAASGDELREKYEEGSDPVRILVAPGHEPMFGGAVYQGVYEREIVLEVAAELKKLLGDNDNYEIVTTRSNTAWSSSLKKYFKSEDDEIEDFVKDYKKLASRLERRGDFTPPNAGDQVSHNAAPTDVALRLYGINKWANENDIDLVINLHVNDAADHGPNDPSRHTGYAIYIPDRQYGNHEASEELAEALEKQLKKVSTVSTHPGENQGIIESQELIAIGAYGTLAVPSVLVEYGYITEPRFALTQYRGTVTKDLAYQTYVAVQDFFDDPVRNPRKVAKLPLTWPKPVIPVATTTPATPVTQTLTPSVPAIPVPPLTPMVPTVPVTPTVPATPVTPSTPSTPAVPVTPATACAAFTTTLKLDLETEVVNEEVKRLQRILAKDKAIYPEGLITGYFGNATERAVKEFQEKNGIVTSGTADTTGYGAVGPKTAAALIKACTP